MEEKWTTVLKPRNKWLDINLKELFSYKDLVFLFVKRNYVTKYKQTILGPLWMIISPLLTTLMHALVFGGIAGISTDGAPQLAFYMAGNVIWTYFAACVNQTSNTFVTNANVFGKVYFPPYGSTCFYGLDRFAGLFDTVCIVLDYTAYIRNKRGRDCYQSVGIGYAVVSIAVGTFGNGCRYYCVVPDYQIQGSYDSGDLWSTALDVCEPGSIFY